jgi:hypothetical protein
MEKKKEEKEGRIEIENRKQRRQERKRVTIIMERVVPNVHRNLAGPRTLVGSPLLEITDSLAPL